MVIAQQMKHRVDSQERDLTLKRMAVQRCLLLCALHADDDIAQHLAAVVLVNIVYTVHTQREAQDVGRHRLVAVLVVQFGNGRVVHEGNADLSRSIEMLILQNCIACTADQNTKAGRNLDSFL